MKKVVKNTRRNIKELFGMNKDKDKEKSPRRPPISPGKSPLKSPGVDSEEGSDRPFSPLPPPTKKSPRRVAKKPLPGRKKSDDESPPTKSPSFITSPKFPKPKLKLPFSGGNKKKMKANAKKKKKSDGDDQDQDQSDDFVGMPLSIS
jgi:hypothetical protein